MDLVDWDFAAATAGRLVAPGPTLSVEDAADVVRDLRSLALDALGHVSAFTGLTPDPALRTSTVVVDRGRWAAQNVAGLQTVLGPLVAKALAAREGSGPNPVVTAVGRKVTAVEVGTVLSFLASKVLGQYEVFLPPADGDGRLSLVAPNIVQVERALAVDPRDFRMWVALHEQTHHLQFTAVPWLRPHLLALVDRLAGTTDLDPGRLLARLRSAVREIRDGADRPGGVLTLLQTPEQRAVVADAQALMTVLEGHADFVMDAVGPAVVPSVALIRSRFEQRRRRAGSPVQVVLRKLLGLDAKLAQYRVGGAFFRTVHAEGGAEAVAAVFADPAHLPTSAELTEPATWLRRVAGSSPGRSAPPLGRR
ncbi:MAG TPA: zinc-dependent metalloprotease [Mycobacteriales bacterium]